ncbi:MAG: YceI family protein, partial [Panacibacter sp.]
IGMRNIINKFIVIGLSLLITTAALAQNLVPVDDASAVKFSIKNFGISTSGDFKGLKGKIVFDALNTAASTFNVTVDASTIDTDINARDNHIKKEDYFDVSKYPVISFASTKITASASSGSFLITGNITIKGITKEVSFPFTVAEKNDGFIFTGNFKLNRRDFKVGGNSISLSDNLTVSLSVYAKRV